MSLADGRRVRLSGWWRYLPKGAAGLSDDELRPLLEEAVVRRCEEKTVGRVRRSVAVRNAWSLPAEDPNCRIWTKWLDLLDFKRGLTGDEGRVQLADYNWNTDASIRANRIYVSGFERYCRMRVEDGGLGLSPDQVSFRLLLNHVVSKRYLLWRLTRYRDLELDGKPIGIKVSQTEVLISGFFSGLLEADFGWITQSAKQLGMPEPITTRFRLPKMRVTKTQVEVIEHDGCPMVEVMPAELVERLVIDWRGVVSEARKHARVMKSNLNLTFKVITDPNSYIWPIIKHAHPIAVMMRFIREALKRVRPLESSPNHHARDYMRIVAALLLLLLVFRSENVRNLIWRADGSGQIRFVDEELKMMPDRTSELVPAHYEISIEGDEFKNVRNALLRGPSYNRKAYERGLKDWGGINGIMSHFIMVCRPILLDGRESDLLLPPPKAQSGSSRKGDESSENDFNYLINTFTSMWCVYNPHYGTGMMGVHSFGPHPFRNIVATHILRHHKGSDRVQLAALVLGTGVRQVEERYGWVDTSAELGKVDYIFDAAAELAESDVPLW